MSTLRALFKARLLRGVLEGSRIWVVVGVLVGARRLARRRKVRCPELVFREELEPGQARHVTHRGARGPNGRAAVPR